VAGDIGIIINISILQAQTNNHQEFWMLIAQGVFGIGGLLGPILVSIF
jgi:fucose permease